MDPASASRRLSNRYDLALLIPCGGISIELGVAEGGFSQSILKSRRVFHHYAVDRYTGERGHDDAQYIRALMLLQPYAPLFTLLRIDFVQATTLFPDNYFDFIYIDGYAHTGQENGRTLDDWWPKLKPGAVFSGDDYSPDYPLTMEAVDNFAKRHQLLVTTTSFRRGDDWASQQQSWLMKKPGTSGSVARWRQLLLSKLLTFAYKL